MKPKPTPPAETLRSLIDYDPETGALTWKARGPECFGPSRRGPETAARVWNGKNAGAPALASKTANGYLHGAIWNDSFLAHRIVWKIVTGEDADDVDHINGDRTDNRIANLRSCSRRENMRNRGLLRNNRSGHHGVWQDGRSGKWYAQIEYDGQVNTIGLFVTIEEAVDARRHAADALGFHPNHGQRLGHDMACAMRV